MSRSGRIPIEIPDSTNVTLSEGYIVAKGKLGELKFKLDNFTDVELNEKSIIVKPKDQSKRSKEMWGTVRSRIFNLVQGVSEGFSKNLLLNGVGYKAILKGKVLELNLGYSHPINFDIPEDITITVKKPTEISVFGSDKQKGCQHMVIKCTDTIGVEPFIKVSDIISGTIIQKKNYPCTKAATNIIFVFILGFIGW